MTKDELQQYEAYIRTVREQSPRLSIVALMDVTVLSNGRRTVHCPGCNAKENFPPVDIQRADRVLMPGSDFSPFMHNDASCPVLRMVQEASRAFLFADQVRA